MKMAKIKLFLQYKTLLQWLQEVRIPSISSVISAKTGINYSDLEPGNEFWNRVRVSSSCYKSCYCDSTNIGTTALHSAPAFAGTHCAYPWRDGQAELTWVTGYISMW